MVKGADASLSDDGLFLSSQAGLFRFVLQHPPGKEC